MKEARSIVSQVLRAYGLEQRVRGFQAGGSWDEIVGPVLARHSEVVDFRDGKLIVEVQGTAARTELQLRSPEWLEAFAKRHGGGLIEEIKFVPAGR